MGERSEGRACFYVIPLSGSLWDRPGYSLFLYWIPYFRTIADAIAKDEKAGDGSGFLESRSGALLECR